MRIAFLSNYFNHHQKPLSDQLADLSEEYYFVSTQPMEQERFNMGWGNDDIPQYVIDYQCNKEKVDIIISDFDIIIYGAAPYEMIKERLHSGKIVLIYSERIFKKGLLYWKNIIRIPRFKQQFSRFENAYLLSASAYAYKDYYTINCFKGRCLRWGYFPACYKYDDIDKILEWKHPASILWVARLIELKHPEMCVELALKLRNEGFDFHITMIGVGPLEDRIKTLIEKYKLNSNLILLGSMTPEQVRTHMEESEIFIFTSDKNEGWGAVLNEAMNSACSVVASSSIGSVPYLIKDNENGMVFKDGKADELYYKVVQLLTSPEERKRMGKNAYFTILNQWNPENAARRLLHTFETKRIHPFEDEGPCSKAPLIDGH